MRAQFNEDEDTQSLHDEENLAIPPKILHQHPNQLRKKDKMQNQVYF